MVGSITTGSVIRSTAAVLYRKEQTLARGESCAHASVLEAYRNETNDMTKKKLKDLFIEDLGQVTGGKKPPLATTLALGEEGPEPTTLALYEEGWETTLALGEEEPLPTA